VFGAALRRWASLLDPLESDSAEYDREELHAMLLYGEYQTYRDLALENGADAEEAHDFGVQVSGCLEVLLGRLTTPRVQGGGRPERGAQPLHDRSGPGVTGADLPEHATDERDALRVRSSTLSGDEDGLDWRRRPE